MNKKLIYGVSTLSLLLALPLPAQSTAPDDAQKDASGNVVVLSKFEVNKNRDVGYFSASTTAGTRSSQANIDIPGSIDIINSELLTDLNVVDPDQALKYGTSGVTSNEQVRDDNIIRGFRQSQIFRDGIASTNFVVNQLYDVDRLEVVKGPSAMVFGNSGVLGGVVNFVPRQPTYTPQGDVSVTVGAENNYVRGVANVSGPLSANHRDIRYRFTVGAQNDDMTKSIEHLNQMFVGGAMDFDFGKSRLSLYGFYIKNDRFIYFDDFLDISVTKGDLTLNKYSTPKFSPADPSQNLYFNDNELYLTATLVTQLSDNFTFRGFYRYRTDDEPRRIIRGITVQADNVTLNRQILNFPYSEYGHTAQVDFIYKLALKQVSQDISFGADYSNVYSRDILAIYPITALNTAHPDFSVDSSLLDQYPINNQNQRTTTEQFSYYVQDFASLLNGKVNLVAGWRWINPNVTQINLLNNTISNRDDPVRQVHRYGIVFKPFPKVSVYATEANTFQVNTGVNHLGIPLIPSIGKIKEFGIKTFDLPFAGGQVFFSGAIFDMALTNVTTVGPLTVVNGQTVNEILQIASDTSKGYEFDLGYRHKVGPGDFNTIVTYYDAKPRSATGLRAIRAPKYTAGILFKYSFTEGSLKGFSIGAGGSWVGNRLATTNGLLYYPAHETYDAFIQYRANQHWSYGFNVDNLTDTRYVNTYAANGLAAANDPRTFRFSAKYAW